MTAAEEETRQSQMLRTIFLSRAPQNSFTKTVPSFCSNLAFQPPQFSSSLNLSTPSTWILSSPYSQGSKQRQQDEPVSYFNVDPDIPPKLFVVQPRLRPSTFMQAKINEALCLANSLEDQRYGYFEIDFFDKEIPPHVVVQNPSLKGVRADTYFGHGTLETIKCHLDIAESKGEINAVFINTTLSGIQQRNLERVLGLPVFDRMGLIIEIFNAHAHSKEAKLQAELAALMYKKSRLVRVRGSDGRRTFGASEEAEVVSARGRGSGGRGFISGAGETELQLQRQRILERRHHLLLQIEEVRRTRALQRAARKKHADSSGLSLATVAVVGYTNAGKSTLVSALSDSDLYCDSRLFATLDSRLRRVILPSGTKILVSDTVGFISDLPVQLVQAFHATLEEVVEADLLVHVVDCTAPNLEEHRLTVFQVLQQIGVSEEKLQNMIEVWNKIDFEDGMEGGKHLDESEDTETGSSAEVEDDMSSTNQSLQNDVNCENLEETMNEEQRDDSDGWLAHEEDEGLWNNENATEDHIIDCSTHSTEKVLNVQNRSMPHVKTSALMGVGLQELLHLIEEKLKLQDEKMKAENTVRNNIFERKWRPPRDEEEGIAAGSVE